MVMMNKYRMEKKEYIKPECKVITFNFKPCLLSSSSDAPDDRDECENPWWCDRQPSADDWWGK